MRHYFIINPAAGKPSSTAALERLLAQVDFAYDVSYTQREGDAQRLARQAAQRGEPVRIYACGGDGTLNEVVNGAAGYDHVAITNVPKGTGNDFLKVFGPEYRARFYNLSALSTGPQAAMDLMDCNGKLGIDVACAGVDARIAADVHRYKNWRFISGMGAYCLALVENVLLRSLSQPMCIQMGELDWRGETCVLCVCNGRYYGGGFQPVPQAMPDDGVLDMLLIPKISKWTFARLVGQYAKGQYKRFPELILSHHGDCVTFSSPHPIITVVDGEVMRDTTFTIRLSEKKVNFFYPQGSNYRILGGVQATEGIQSPDISTLSATL